MKNANPLSRLEKALRAGREEEIVIAVVEGEKLCSQEELSLIPSLTGERTLLLLLRCALPPELKDSAQEIFKNSPLPMAQYALQILNSPAECQSLPCECDCAMIRSCKAGDARSMTRLCREGARITCVDTVLKTVAFSRLSDEGIRFLFKYGMTPGMRCLTLMTLVDEEERYRRTAMGEIYRNMVTIMANLFLEECYLSSEEDPPAGLSCGASFMYRRREKI